MNKLVVMMGLLAATAFCLVNCEKGNRKGRTHGISDCTVGDYDGGQFNQTMITNRTWFGHFTTDTSKSKECHILQVTSAGSEAIKVKGSYYVRKNKDRHCFTLPSMKVIKSGTNVTYWGEGELATNNCMKKNQPIKVKMTVLQVAACKCINMELLLDTGSNNASQYMIFTYKRKQPKSNSKCTKLMMEKNGIHKMTPIHDKHCKNLNPIGKSH